MTSIAVLLASRDVLSLRDGAQYPCGFWAEELVEPWRLFEEDGVSVLIVTPDGARATAEPASVDPATALVDQARCDSMLDFLHRNRDALEAPVAAEQVDVGGVDGIYVPGGYAPLAQLHDHEHVGTLLRRALTLDVPIATVCHGAAALLSCSADGEPWPFAGKEVTCFSDAEEEQAGMDKRLTWTLEQALRAAGARYSAEPPWAQNTIATPGLITGQNPASALPVARALLRQAASVTAR